jgi:hypothetical protein
MSGDDRHAGDFSLKLIPILRWKSDVAVALRFGGKVTQATYIPADMPLPMLCSCSPRDECQAIGALPRSCMGREHVGVLLNQAPGRRRAYDSLTLNAARAAHLSCGLRACDCGGARSVKFANGKENYYTESERIRGQWQGQLADRWGLKGGVNEEQFARPERGQASSHGRCRGSVVMMFRFQGWAQIVDLSGPLSWTLLSHTTSYWRFVTPRLDPLDLRGGGND